MKRNRVRHLVAACAFVVLGLASRRFAAFLPPALAPYLGDALWALMVFFIVRCLAPRWSPLRAGGAALLLSYAVEVSQLYHAPWIDRLRHTRLSGLVLGYGFLWSDIACYTAGVALGVLVEVGIHSQRADSTIDGRDASG